MHPKIKSVAPSFFFCNNTSIKFSLDSTRNVFRISSKKCHKNFKCPRVLPSCLKDYFRLMPGIPKQHYGRHHFPRSCTMGKLEYGMAWFFCNVKGGVIGLSRIHSVITPEILPAMFAAISRWLLSTISPGNSSRIYLGVSTLIHLVISSPNSPCSVRNFF